MLSEAPYLQSGKGLKVLMPLVHWQRALGVAYTLKKGGHRMYLTGPTFEPTLVPCHKMTREEAVAAFGENVHSYEGREILFDIPDVMIVGREDAEDSTYALWKILSQVKPIVLVAYSGVFQSKFSWKIYRGAICTDFPSRVMSRMHDVPAIAYRESFRPESLPYEPYVSKPTLPVRSYINQFAQRFPLSVAFHQECKAAINAAFGSAVSVANVTDTSFQETLGLMKDAALTLHIKDEEGFGWSVLESLSIGRPIIAQAGLSKNMAYLDWVEPNVSAFFVNTPQDVVDLIKSFLSDNDCLVAAQEAAARIVRERFDVESAADDLNAFLEDLVRLEQSRWMPRRPTVERLTATPHYMPTLDALYEQGYEQLLREFGTPHRFDS